MSEPRTASENPLKPIYLVLSIGFFCLLFALSYPYYRYFIDPDAVAYLTMAKRAAEGDYWRLINALWSPLHPAMVALCITAGINEVLAAQLTNGAACVVILYCCYSLFKRYNIERFAAIVFLLVLPLFLVYALYKQLFCDLWQIAFLLIYLLLITSKNFLRSWWRWVLCAFVMALATYAKVYSFYFLLLHLPVALYLIRKLPGRPRFPQFAWLMIMLFQVLFIAPLVLLQHHKYGGWSLSKSGELNTSWTLTGHKTHKEGITTLIPPPYPNSPYTWEDPYLAEGAIHSRFESPGMVKSQVLHAGEAALQGVDAAHEISAFLLAVLVLSLLIVLFKRNQGILNANHKILLAAACIMPIGYLLLHFEARYIWLLLFMTVIIGARWLEAFGNWTGNKNAYRVAVVVFALSFIAYPAYDLRALFRWGQDVYEEANTLKAMGITGSFTSNDNPSRSGALAYWMGTNFYTPTKEKVTEQEVLADMRRYKVRYYINYQKGLDVVQCELVDESGQPFPEVTKGTIPGLQAFLVNP